MSSNIVPPRVFQALNGSELKRVVLARIEKSLDEDPRFKRHLTYPLVSFAYRIAVSAYPMDPGKFEVAGTGQVAATGTKPAPGASPEQFEVAGDLYIDAPRKDGLRPDEARKEAGIGVPVPEAVRVAPGQIAVVDVERGGNPSVEHEPAPLVDPFSDVPTTTVASPAVDQVGPPPSVSAIEATMAHGVRSHLDVPPPPAPEPFNRRDASPHTARSVNIATRPVVEEEGESAPGVARVNDNILGR